MRFFISAYTVKIYQKGDKNKGKQRLKLDNLPGNKDFFTIFNGFLKTITTSLSVNNTQKNVLKVGSKIDIDRKERIYTGIIEGGVFGINSNLVDVNTGKTSYIRKEYDAETLPFYFMFYIPNRRDEGILLLESIGRYDIKRNFGKCLRDFMISPFPELSVEISKLIPAELIDDLLSKSRTTKMKLIKYGIPRDKFDKLDEPHKEEEFDINREIVYSSRDLQLKDKIKKMLKRNVSVKDLFELKEIQEEDYDKLKFELKIGSTTKTIDLDKLDDINNSIDITDDVSINIANGYPYPDSLKSTFWFYLEYFRDKLDGKI